jgi:hypothetical protein
MLNDRKETVMAWCLSDAECNYNKALIVELTERVAKLEKVIVQEMGKEVLELINTWPIKEVEHGGQ